MASIYDRAGGLLELLAQGATGGAAQLGGGLTYAATAPFVGNDAAQAMKRSVEGAYTYQPRTETAQGILGAIGRTIAPAVNYAGGNIERSAQQAGEYAGPAGYAAVKTLPTVLQTLVDRPKIGSAVTRNDITAYHGTPHDFDRFDLSKIGTGEGAQVYGHGLYFADSPDVAKTYRDTLVQDRVGPASSLLARHGGDIDAAISSARAEADRLKGLNLTGDGLKRANSMIAAQEDNISTLMAMKTGGASSGRLYTVDIPDEHVAKMLDWDKPLSEQSKGVIAAIQAQSGPDIWEKIKGMRGQDYYESYWDAGVGGSRGGVQASASLADMGIPGIRYLDQGSRGAGSGTRNTVVFDDKIIKILKKE